MDCAVYLRKSRADIEAEARGEGETLARHEHTLLELAKKRGISIVKIYREVVSGENIAARPQVQQLLADVSEKKYDGVIVMEIERLARGDTIDQGVVAQAFKSSDTKIITPVKDYDPNNEFDEEYFEFGLFMSRREYKTIKRRMNAGRLASVKEGNYIVSTRPYGYERVNPEPKVHTLKLVPDEAETVRFIFAEYLSGKGSKKIAAELNEMGIKPVKSNTWSNVSVKKILQNPVYAGKLTWRTKGCENEIFDGVHEAIIPYEDFLRAQVRKKENAPKVKNNDELKNYYQGLLYCSNCGRAMRRRLTASRGYEHYLCRSYECRGIISSSRVENINELVISSISNKIKSIEKSKKYKSAKSTKTGKSQNTQKEKMLKSELTKLRNQQNKLYDFLEQGVYDTNTYLERSALLKGKIDECAKALAELERAAAVAPQISDEEKISRLENVLENFDKMPDATAKNALLKTVIKRIEYSKSERMCRNRMDSDLKLQVEFLF